MKSDGDFAGVEDCCIKELKCKVLSYRKDTTKIQQLRAGMEVVGNCSKLPMMRRPFLVRMEGTLPVLFSMTIEARDEHEAAFLAQLIAESQKTGVKTATLAIERYPLDFLRFEGVSEVTPIDADDSGKQVWTREAIERLLGDIDSSEASSQRGFIKASW